MSGGRKTKVVLAPKPGFFDIKGQVRYFFQCVRELQGNPHTVALGMAIGVVIAFTPTIPFQTIIAIMLAFICRASKAAAALGTLISNPVTIPPMYFVSYKLGTIIVRTTSPIGTKTESIFELIKTEQIDLVLAMLAGSILLGIIPGAIAYLLTRKAFNELRSRHQAKQSAKSDQYLE